MTVGEGFVWPGVKTIFNNPGLDVAKGKDVPQSPRQFSFDWSRGSSGNGKREQSTPFLSAWGTYGEGAPFTSRQRWKHFVLLLLLSGLMFVIAGLFLPLVLLRPQKFCLFFTLGSVLSMASFAVLRGPIEQLKHMFSLQRYTAALHLCYTIPSLPPQACGLDHSICGMFLANAQVTIHQYLPGIDGLHAVRCACIAELFARDALHCDAGGGPWLVPPLLHPRWRANTEIAHPNLHARFHGTLLPEFGWGQLMGELGRLKLFAPLVILACVVLRRWVLCY